MPTLTDEEAAVLRAVLSCVVVRQRTGQVGLTHGLDRFVATELLLKKPQRTLLDAAAKKLGLATIAIDKG